MPCLVGPTRPYAPPSRGMASPNATEVEPLLGAATTTLQEENVPRSRRNFDAEAGGWRFVVKLLATLYSFVLLGFIISTPGVILPHLEEHYHLNDIQASLIFLVAPVGYLLGARLNVPIHRRLGQRGIALIAPVCQVVFTGTISTFHDPQRAGFPLFLVATVVGNVGSGLLDGSWCAWAGGLGGNRTNTVQGLLHGSFSIGAGLGPFLAGTMFSVWEWPWWMWYNFLLVAVVLESLVLNLAFRSEDRRRYRENNLKELEQQDELGVEPARTTTTKSPSSSPSSQVQVQVMKGFLQYPATWICAAYFLVYVGTEGAISGWIVTFMQRARHASPYLASLSSTGFWLGMAAGRLALGPVTDRWFRSVRSAVVVYLIIAITLQAGLAAPLDVAAVSTALIIAAIGLFLGPLFPSGIVVLARALPRDLHVGAVSFVASIGQLGAALLPFVLGSLSQWLGIRVFQGFILAMLVGTLLIWCAFPSGEDDDDDDEATDDVCGIGAGERQETNSGDEPIVRNVFADAAPSTAGS